jgi:hypothetical protein
MAKPDIENIKSLKLAVVTLMTVQVAAAVPYDT